MDGIHDLGGKPGYGSIKIDEPEGPFHHAWEAREWGISRCARTPDISIDWWRHCRELIMPEDYLERPYFDSWAQTDFATYIDAGVMSLDEVVSGITDPDQYDKEIPPLPLNKTQVILEDRKSAFRFDAEIDTNPIFSIGQEVITDRQGHDGHTRLPQYARGKRGIVHAHHGAHVYPDLSARGEETHQHLYSIVFEAKELWPEDGGTNDKVYLDLWENYLLEQSI